MAVEATHLNLFPTHLIQDRDLMNSCNQGNIAAYNTPQQQRLFPAIPTLPGNQCFYQLPAVCGSLPPAKNSVNTDSGLTYNIITSVPRSNKRLRESMNDQVYTATLDFPAPQKNINNNNNNSISQFPSFVGQDILPQIKQHQFEMDTIISHHTKKIRLVLEERQKQHTRLVTAAIEQGVIKKLKEKDEQIQKMCRLNLILQERVKSLYVENQLWRDLAQSNEATANSLRSDLEQVLATVNTEERISAVEEDAESCCGSTHDKDGDHRNSFTGEKSCRRCGEGDSCVLLLPCRHLCLCNVCGGSSHRLQVCPVCNVNMTATLHVNMS